MFLEVLTKLKAIADLWRAGDWLGAVKASLELGLLLVAIKTAPSVMAAVPDEKAKILAACDKCNELSAPITASTPATAFAPGEMLAVIRAITELVRLIMG